MVDVWCGGCLVWWVSGVVNAWCGECLVWGCPILLTVWWMSGVVDVIFTHGVVDIWCGGCPVWWISGVVDVLFYIQCGHVVDVWCGGYLCGGCRTNTFGQMNFENEST